jgi:AmmeMemoRadiSam system protein B
MERQFTRRAAVAGTWYPDDRAALTAEVDEYLRRAGAPPAGQANAIIAPHAGLMYSGPVAAYAYALVARRSYEAIAMVGPSHFSAFEGVALVDRGVFLSPMGDVAIHEEIAAALLARTSSVQADPSPHVREHSLEMQLPFLGRVLAGIPIVPMLMGYQDRDTIRELAAALSEALAGREVLLVASTDLSHYFDSATAARLDHRVIELVDGFDPEGMLREFERYPEHERGRYFGCGGGPAIAVALAARSLGATGSRVLRYADSGDVSGDKSAVVGYLAAAFGDFTE